MHVHQRVHAAVGAADGSVWSPAEMPSLARPSLRSARNPSELYHYLGYPMSEKQVAVVPGPGGGVPEP